MKPPALQKEDLAKVLILKIYVPCKKRGEKRKTKPGFTILIYLFLANEVDCQALISNKEMLLLPKPPLQMRSINSFIVPAVFCLLESQLGLKHTRQCFVSLVEPLAGWRQLFPEMTTQSWQTPPASHPATSKATRSTVKSRKWATETWRLWRWSSRETHVRMNSIARWRWRWRSLTKQWLNHHVLLLPKIWPGARAVPRLLPVPTVHDRRAAETPCHQDWCIMNGRGTNRLLNKFLLGLPKSLWCGAIAQTWSHFAGDFSQPLQRRPQGENYWGK